jgi:hypothetical protein
MTIPPLAVLFLKRNKLFEIGTRKIHMLHVLNLERGILRFFYVHYSTMLHLPPLRFHCVGKCWDRTQCWNFRTTYRDYPLSTPL